MILSKLYSIYINIRQTRFFNIPISSLIMRALVITNTITRRDEKSLEKYFNEISRYGVLSPEEELEMFKKIKMEDEDALQKIVNHNLRFVVSVSKQYQGLGLSLGDLINEGNLGLIKAATRFDETKGFKFISYAVWWIRQSILQALNEKSRKIRLPLNHQSNVSKIISKRTELLQKMEREPTMEELAEETGFSEEVVRKSLQSYKKCRSLDAPVDEDSDTSLSGLMEDKQVERPDYDLAYNESIHIQAQQLLDILPPREASVLKLFFGIDRKYPMNLGEISETMGISRERVRQIKDRGLDILRKASKRSALEFSLN